jgi:hypothetical protein
MTEKEPGRFSTLLGKILVPVTVTLGKLASCATIDPESSDKTAVAMRVLHGRYIIFL